MTDNVEDALRESFLFQARHCHNLGSPFVATLCELFAERFHTVEETASLLSGWPQNQSFIATAFPLRLIGALHYLVLCDLAEELKTVFPPDQVADKEVLWSAIVNAASTHGDTIREFIKSPPQTNEIRRSVSLLPGFLTIAERTNLPLSLSEIGASAGLNLFWDRYHYDYGCFAWGEPHSTIHLSCQWQGELPALGNPSIVDRAGCDLSPPDVSKPEDERRLLSYVWADQRERFDRIRAAIRFARQQRVRVDTGDALVWLQGRIGATKTNTVQVVYHTIVWQYLPSDTQTAIQQLLEQYGKTATASSPLAWLRVEPDGDEPGARISLTLWPGGTTCCLGRADFHGRWVNWLGLDNQ